MVHNTISQFVADLNAGKPAAIADNDEGYVLKKSLEYCHRNNIHCGHAILSTYFSTYYMGETVSVPFELPFPVLVVGDYRYRLSRDEGGDEVIYADLIPDDYEMMQDVARLNHMLDTHQFDDPDGMWWYIENNLPDLNEYVLAHAKAPFQVECEKVLEELGVHLIK